MQQSASELVWGYNLELQSKIGVITTVIYHPVTHLLDYVTKLWANLPSQIDLSNSDLEWSDLEDHLFR